jgi:protein-S-isoprenylcysteine O-methyltransferase Ste14
VRNPIFTGMVLFAAGQALLVPSRLAVVGAGLLVGAVEAQVRHVEEPALLATHGDAYRRWASSTGRFVPAVGRLR